MFEIKDTTDELIIDDDYSSFYGSFYFQETYIVYSHDLHTGLRLIFFTLNNKMCEFSLPDDDTHYKKLLYYLTNKIQNKKLTIKFTQDVKKVFDNHDKQVYALRK